MKLKFNKLQYQQDAISAIMKVLNGTYILNRNDGYANPKLEFNEVNLCLLITKLQKEHGFDKVSNFE